MVDITIYSKNGTEKAVVKTLEYDGNFMGDRFVTVSVSSPTVINWAIGDYLDYRGERWTLWLLPATSKTASVRSYGGAIEYKDLRFCPNEEELRRCSFLDVVKSDNEIHYTSLPNFSFYCSCAQDLADRIQANLDRLYPGQWTIEANEAASITDQSLTFSDNSCWDALVTANTTLGLNFIIDSANRTVTIGGEGAFIETVMQYGKGNGLKGVERTVDDNQQVINRLYAYGNTRNLPYRYYNKRYAAGSSVFDMVQSMYLPNLMLPGICKGWDAADAVNYLDQNGNIRHHYGSEGQEIVFNDSTHWYENLDGTTYEGTVYWLYRHYSLSEDEQMYYCDRVWIESEDSINKCGVQEGVKFFDGSDDLVDDIYPSITGFSSTEELATAVGETEAALQNLSYEQGALDEIMGAIVDSWDGIIPEEEEATPTFSIRIKNIGFDLSDAELDASGDTPRLSMKSGMCAGREFNILECKKQVLRNGAWEDFNPSSPVTGQWSYLLTCEVAADESIGQYFPNNSFTLASGDRFVILGIKMPDVYVDVAENRLLKAAIVWLSENDKTSYSYMPAINNIYMQDNPETSALMKEGNVLHVYDEDLGIDVEMTISNLKIKNDKPIPEFEVTLSNDKEADLVQRVTAQVNQTYTQFIGNGGSGGTGIYLIGTASNIAPTDNNAFSARRSLRMFLRKDVADAAAGKITFEAGTDTKTTADFSDYRGFASGWMGYGARIGTDQLGRSGVAEFEEVNIRGALRAAELVFNKISAEEGEAIRSIGHGEIETVDEENFTATLKLEGDEWATIDVDDICRGLYNTVNKEFDNATDEGEDGNGFRLKAGFFASYFRIEEILTSTKGSCSFRYSLQPGTTEHPCPLMKFAVYGNFNRYNEAAKKARQSSMYITAVGIAPRLLFLAGVDDWQIKPQNIKVALGNIDGVQVWEQRNGNVTLKTLHGDAGLFVEDNIYLGGIINQFTAADWQAIQDRLGQGISAQLLRGSDNIIVDALGNIVGGIYTEYGSGQNVVRRYKLHTGVLVYDSGKGIYLTAQTDHTQPLGDNEYYIFHTCVGCEVLQDGSDYYVVGINNTFNGFTGSALSESQLEAMRNTDECLVNFVIVTKSGWRTMMTYSVKISHLDTSYITFDLTNEMDSFSYRTQLKQYAGLPITTQLKAYANGEELPDSAYLSSSVESDAFTGEITSSSDLQEGSAFVGNDSTLYGLKCSITKVGLFTLQTYGRRQNDIPDNKFYFDISCIVKYAGVNYSSPKKRFIVTEATDATLYKIMLSASAVSKDGGTYTPATIDASVKICDDTGVKVGVPGTDGQVTVNNVAVENIYFRYLSQEYDPSWSASTLMNGWATSMPSFSNVPTCMTVMVVDLENQNSPVILDLETVPMTAVGRDGAGQPWIDVYPETIVIDCDEDGDIASPVAVTVSAKLYYGDTPLALNQSGCDIYINGQQTTAPDRYSGGGLVAERDFTFQGNGFDSTEIRIYLSDSNGDHSASKTVQVIANKKGPKGDTGRAGASLRFKGNWVDGEYYVWDETFRDCVKHEGVYWFVNVDSDGTDLLGEPTSENDKWMQVSNLQIVATELLLAEEATIQNLIATRLLTGITPNPHIKAVGSLMEFYGRLPFPNIRLGVIDDENDPNEGCAILEFYDKNGTYMYNLGPNGITFMDSTKSTFSETLLLDITEYARNKVTSGLIGLTNISDSLCETYYRFIEGYVKSGDTKIYRIGYNNTPSQYPSQYNNHLYDSDELSSSELNAHPTGNPINGWFIAPNYGDYPIWGTTNYYFISAFYYADGRLLGTVEILFRNEHDWWRDTDGTIRGGLSQGSSLLDYLNSKLGLTPY